MYVPELHSENGGVEPALVVVQRVGARVLERKPIFHLRVCACVRVWRMHGACKEV